MKRGQMLVLAGVAAVLVFLFAGGVAVLHGVSVSAGRSTIGEITTVLGPSQTSAPAPSCPASGPLAGLNTGETIGLLVLIVVAGIGGGIAIGRFLNPQPLPPGVYVPRSGPSGRATGDVSEPPDPAMHAVANRKAGGGNTPGQEYTWTDGGKTAGDDISGESKE